VCGLKYRLVKNGDALMLLTKYFVDGEWIALKSQPLCVKVKTTKGKASKEIDEATIRADERAKTEAEIVAWLHLQARGLIGTGRVAEINTLTLCADAIRDGVVTATKGGAK